MAAADKSSTNDSDIESRNKAAKQQSDLVNSTVTTCSKAIAQIVRIQAAWRGHMIRRMHLQLRASKVSTLFYIGIDHQPVFHAGRVT